MNNFYLGGYEYGIVYRNGKHVIIDWSDYLQGKEGIEFTGTYQECCTKRDQMIAEYAESLL